MDLSGKLLIAMPGMGDPRFERSVVMVCAHSPEGAMGLIVNKPLPKPDFPELLENLEIVQAGHRNQQFSAQIHAPILFGGPVETGRGFVLHSPDWTSDAGMMYVSEALRMTGTRDILEDIAMGRGPDRALFALGYVGWGPGQIESELLDNGWLTTEPDDDLALDRDYGTKWTRALQNMGVNPHTLSSTAGHA